MPTDVAREIDGSSECVLADYLRTAIQYFEGASRVTAAELRERFREDDGGMSRPSYNREDGLRRRKYRWRIARAPEQ